MKEKKDSRYLLNKFMICSQSKEDSYIKKLAATSKTLVIDINKQREEELSHLYYSNKSPISHFKKKSTFFYYLFNLLPLLFFCLFLAASNFFPAFDSYAKFVLLIVSLGSALNCFGFHFYHHWKSWLASQNQGDGYCSYEKLLVLIKSRQFDLIECSHLYFEFETHANFAINEIQKELDSNQRTAVYLTNLNFQRTPKMTFLYNAKFNLEENISRIRETINKKSKN
ncbi:MAG: hypothetical protein H0U57_00655 [Tatlockia sp.]|nr:hypothetical protein [Tatlockia sp.]